MNHRMYAVPMTMMLTIGVAFFATHSRWIELISMPVLYSMYATLVIVHAKNKALTTALLVSLMVADALWIATYLGKQYESLIWVSVPFMLAYLYLDSLLGKEEA